MAEIIFEGKKYNIKVESNTIDLLAQLFEVMSMNEKPEPKQFIPEIGEKFYFLMSPGDIEDDVKEIDDDFFNNLYAIGNCFKTKEDAKHAVEKLKVITELKRYASEHNEEIDWGNNFQSKYELTYDPNENTVKVVRVSQKGGGIYFSSFEICMEACIAVGEERIKKYYLNI